MPGFTLEREVELLRIEVVKLRHESWIASEEGDRIKSIIIFHKLRSLGEIIVHLNELIEDRRDRR